MIKNESSMRVYLINIQQTTFPNKQDYLVFFCRSPEKQVVFCLENQPYVYVSGSDEKETSSAAKKCSCSQVRMNKNVFKGFENSRVVFQCFFSNTKEKYFAAKTLKKKGFQVYESSINPEIQFICDNDIYSNGWYEISNFEVLEESAKCVYLHVESVKDFRYRADIILPPLVNNLCFDIEASSSTGDFPNPEKPLDRVTQIGMVFQLNGKKKKILLNLGPCDPSDDFTVVEHVHDDPDVAEFSMLRSFFCIINQEYPDTLIGYNSFCFDEYFIFKRMQYLQSLNKVPASDQKPIGGDPSTNQLSLHHWMMSKKVLYKTHKVCTF